MNKINVKLYQACIAVKLRMHKIASMAGIENTRLSKILNGKLQPTVEEKRILSKILKTSQKNLF
jgi:transcriptional regulator with XRE-family HTH domain